VTRSLRRRLDRLELAREPAHSTGDYLAEVLEEFCATADPEECARALELIDRVAAEQNDRESPAIAVGPEPAAAIPDSATADITAAVELPARAPPALAGQAAPTGAAIADMPPPPPIVPDNPRKYFEEYINKPPRGPRPPPPPPYRDPFDDPLGLYEK
jgi:hypothetical protein